MLTPEYTAGFLDGEGHFSLILASYQRQITCENTYAPVIFELQQTWGGRVYKVKLNPRARKQSWRWVISRATGAIPMLEAIIPHLREKRGVAEVMLASMLESRDRAKYPPRTSLRRVG